MSDEIVHQAPLEGTGTTVCCGRAPFELPTTDKMTIKPALVTCGKVVCEFSHTTHMGYTEMTNATFNRMCDRIDNRLVVNADLKAALESRVVGSSNAVDLRSL